MKFIGQFIQNLIARFRNDVYLENVSSGTIASGGNLGLDSNNKIVKANEVSVSDADTTTKGIVELATTAETTTGTDATRAVTPDGLKDGYQGSTNVTTLGSITTGTWRGSAIDQAYLTGVSGTNTGDQTSVSGNAGTATALETARNIAGVAFDGTADISLNNNAITNGAGYTTNTGDIERVTINTSSGSAQVTSGNADFTLSGTTPIGVTNSGTTITIAANDASTSAKGVASFSSSNFAVSSGSVSIKSGGVDLTDEVTGTLPVANGGTGLTSISTLLNSNVTTKETLHINIVGPNAANTNDYVGYGGHYQFNISGGSLSNGTTKNNNWASKWSHYRCLEDTTLTQAKAYVSTGANFDSQIRFFKTAPNLAGTGNVTLTHLFDLDFTGNANTAYVSEDTDTAGHSLSAGDLLLISVKKGSATSGQMFAELSIRLE